MNVSLASATNGRLRNLMMVAWNSIVAAGAGVAGLNVSLVMATVPRVIILVLANT